MAAAVKLARESQVTLPGVGFLSLLPKFLNDWIHDDTAWCRISVVTLQIHGMTGYKMTVGQQMVAVGYLCFVIQFRN